MNGSARLLVSGVMVMTVVWGGALVAGYMLQQPVEKQPDQSVSATTRPTTGASQLETPQESTVADRRKRLAEVSAQPDNRNQRSAPPGRIVDESPTVLPAPDDAITKPTIVSLHVKDASVRDVLTELGKQSHARLLIYPPETARQYEFPTITIDADQQPLLQVLDRLCGMTSLSITGTRALASSGQAPVPPSTPDRPVQLIRFEQTSDAAPGPTVVSGALGLELIQIERQAPLGAAAGNPIQAELSFQLLHEPRIVVLAEKPTMKVIEAVDELGHSLLPTDQVAQPTAASPQVHRSWAGAMLNAVASGFGGNRQVNVSMISPMNDWQEPSENFNLTLATPTDVGRKIVRLKGSAECLVQVKADDIAIDLTPGSAAVTQDAGGLKVTIGPLQANGDQFSCPLQFARGKQTDEQWQQLRRTLAASRPLLLDKSGAVLRPLWVNQQSMSDKLITLNGSWMSRWYYSNQSKLLVPARLTMSVPSETRSITVPVELHDLPLP